MRPALWFMIVISMGAQSLWSAPPEPAPGEKAPPVFTVPEEFQRSLGESGMAPEIRPWAAGAAAAASAALMFFSYRSLAAGLEAAQNLRPAAEIHRPLFSGAALGFAAACLGVIIQDLLLPPGPPEIISEE